MKRKGIAAAIGLIVSMSLAAYFLFFKPATGGGSDVCPSVPTNLNIYGKLLDYQIKAENIISLSIQQEIRNYEINPAVIQVDAKVGNISLQIGENYSFNFIKYKNEDMWRLFYVENEFDWDAAYRAHEGDLNIQFVFNWEGGSEPGMEVRLIPTIAKENEPLDFFVKITSTQDQPLEYTFAARILIDNDDQEIMATQGDPSVCCSATGLNRSGTIPENTTETLTITVVCDDVIKELRDNIASWVSGSLRYDETFGKYFITADLSFIDELGKVHQKTTGNSLFFAVRPKERITPPDNREYMYYENLPIDTYDWRNRVCYFFVEGFTLDRTEVTWTSISEHEMGLWTDNPVTTCPEFTLTFGDNMPMAHRRIQLYGILDHGTFSALKWGYLE